MAPRRLVEGSLDRARIGRAERILRVLKILNFLGSVPPVAVMWARAEWGRTECVISDQTNKRLCFAASDITPLRSLDFAPPWASLRSGEPVGDGGHDDIGSPREGSCRRRRLRGLFRRDATASFRRPHRRFARHLPFAKRRPAVTASASGTAPCSCSRSCR